MSEKQRERILRHRRDRRHPWHSPPHYESESTTYYMVTAACFEHQKVIGASKNRIQEFQNALLSTLESQSSSMFVWCILPNHYHALLQTSDIKTLLHQIGRLHGRTSRQWNKEDGLTGRRQVWCKAAETAMKSEAHYFASINYILNNAVHHGYVQRWSEWPYCNAKQFVQTLGEDAVRQQWKQFPIDSYGLGWDPADL